MSGVVRNGVYLPLEREADALISESLRGVTSQSEKSDVLTRWKQQDRWSREVYSNSGTVDPAIRRGMFHRVINPVQSHLNSREGVAPPQRSTSSPIRFLSTSTNDNESGGDA